MNEANAAYMIRGFHEKFAPFSSGFVSHATDTHLFLCVSLVSIQSSCYYVCVHLGRKRFVEQCSRLVSSVLAIISLYRL